MIGCSPFIVSNYPLVQTQAMIIKLMPCKQNRMLRLCQVSLSTQAQIITHSDPALIRQLCIHRYTVMGGVSRNDFMKQRLIYSGQGYVKFREGSKMTHSLFLLAIFNPQFQAYWKSSRLSRECGKQRAWSNLDKNSCKNW